MINKVLLNCTVMSPLAVLVLESRCTLPSVAVRVHWLHDTAHKGGEIRYPLAFVCFEK